MRHRTAARRNFKGAPSEQAQPDMTVHAATPVFHDDACRHVVLGSPVARRPPFERVPRGARPLRVASFNVRVDHTEDRDTVHDWPQVSGHKHTVTPLLLAISRSFIERVLAFSGSCLRDCLRFQRRPLVAATILGLRADVICLQEPSPVQASHLEDDLGGATLPHVLLT